MMDPLTRSFIFPTAQVRLAKPTSQDSAEFSQEETDRKKEGGEAKDGVKWEI